MPLPPIVTDKSKDLDKWYIYPEMLDNRRFKGFENREDASMLRGSFVVGQNVTFGSSGLPSLRKGFESVGTEATDSTPVNRAWLFENRAGSQFELKIYDTKLAYWLVGTSTDWTVLKTGLTANTNWAFANIGKTTDNETSCEFSNGVDGVYKFNGANTTVDSASAAAGAVASVSFVADGKPTAVTVATAGAGYAVGDYLYLQGGDYAASVRVDTISSSGGVATISLNTVGFTGTGYSVATVATVGGSGGSIRGYSACTINITSVSATGGTGYTLGDVLTINAGGVNAQVTVTALNAGKITAVSITAPGSGYAVAGAIACTGGTGAGFTINVDAIGTGWIKKSGTTSWQTAGFYSSGSNTLSIAGTEYTATGKGDSLFMVGVTPSPAAIPAGTLVVQTPVLDPNMTQYQGSVMLAHDGRLHMRKESKKTLWQYSALDDPFTFSSVSQSLDGASGSKEIEFGGPITAFGKLNKTVLCFKKRQIKMLDYLQFGTHTDSPRYQTLVAGDDKGTTLGAINDKSTFSTPLGMVFITVDKRLVLLTGVTANNEPQYVFLSDPIQPIFSQGVFDAAAGICVNNVIYIAFKQDSTSSFNDVVLRGDMTRQSVDTNGRILPIRWDAPFIGWNVSDFTVIYNTTTFANEIHWHSSLNSSSYRLIDQKSDNTTGYTGTIRTWSEHFENPSLQKRIEEIFVEIRMNENSSVLCTVLYDEDGFTGQDGTTLTGVDAAYKFGGTAYNTFGATKYGSAKMGSNINSDVPPVYRYNLEVNPNVYFFNVSLQLSVDGDGQDFELVRFGYKLSEIVKDTDRKYLKG